MQHLSRLVSRPPSQSRRASPDLLALALCVARSSRRSRPSRSRRRSSRPAGAFAPSVADGVIAEGTVVTLADDEVPAIARLDPALRRSAACRQRRMPRHDGLFFEVTSGWRSRRVPAVAARATRSSSTPARRSRGSSWPRPTAPAMSPAMPSTSRPVDAQFWLIEHGARYGICQTYANERWHFELATEPGGVCPGMKADAAS